MEILDIQVNDLISGEKLSEQKKAEQTEENIVSTINYTNNKIKEKNNILGIVFIIFGLILDLTAMTVFSSESSWGSSYSTLGLITILIGLQKYIKKQNILKD